MTDDKKRLEDDLIYNLKNKFEYAFKGEMRDAVFVTIKPPTVSNISSVARLKQGFMQAIAGDQATKNKDTSVETKETDDDMSNLSSEMIMTMLSMSKIDYAGYLETAKHVFTGSDICLIDGEMSFNKETIKKLSFDDLEGITGEYLRVFILSSVLQMMIK